MSNQKIYDPKFESIISNMNDNSNSFFKWIPNINFTTWIIIILVILLLRCNNAEYYLAKIIKPLIYYFKKLIEYIINLFKRHVLVPINETKQKTQELKDKVETAVNTGVVIEISAHPYKNEDNHDNMCDELVEDTNDYSNIDQDNELNAPQENFQNNNYQEDDSHSSIQNGKSAFSYIGEDTGFSNFAEVGDDSSISGKIFPKNNSFSIY
jgi:hypothetical protein